MVIALISLALLLYQTVLWLIEDLLHFPTAAAQDLARALQMTTPHNIYAQLGLAALGCVGAFTLRRQRPELRKALLILSALNVAHAARLSWQPDSPTHPAPLWCLAIIISFVAGLAFRAVPRFSQSIANLSDGGDSKPPLSRGIWIGIVAVLGIAAALFAYRIVDTPGELNAFGLQAIVSARRLIHGELAFKELILLREMTQEECGFSLPFVLWHALFQTIFGGVSVMETRVACAVASWLSIIFMFRVARSLAGPLYGLLAMTIYAFTPLTLFTARSEGIFGFSALLLLISTDIIFAFIKRPSTPRALLVGITVPLCAYGLANIKLMLLAPLATVVVAMCWNQRLRRSWWRLGYSILLTGIIFIPQFMNFSVVKQQVEGRGEHIFGLYFLQSFQGNYEKLWETRKEILVHNTEALAEATFGPRNEEILTLNRMIAMPSALAALVAVGLTLSLAQLHRPYQFFVLALFATAYLGPLLSTSPTLNRRYLFSLAHTMAIACVWLELIAAFRTARLRSLLLSTTALSLIVSLGMGILASWGFLNYQWPLPPVRDYISLHGEDRVVFFPDGRETYLNYLMWNPPTVGRSSQAHIPIVGIRHTSAEATKKIADEFGIPALILSEQEPTFDITGWKLEKTGGPMWALISPPRPSTGNPIVLALDPMKLHTRSPLFIERLSYISDDLFDARIEHPARSTTFQVPVDMERAVVLVRSNPAYPPPIPVTILFDNGATTLTKSIQFSAENGAHYYIVEGLRAGTHTMSLEASTPNDTSWVDDVVIIGATANK
jgi:hypothetical protein